MELKSKKFIPIQENWLLFGMMLKKTERVLQAMRFSVREAEGGETTPSFGHPFNVRRGETTPSFGHPSKVRRGETTPSFGHPSNVRRGKGGTVFGAERSEVPKGLQCNLPIERFTPTLLNEPYEA